MCVVSNIGDSWRRDVPERFSWIPFEPNKPLKIEPTVTRAEFDELKKEMQELKLLLKAAKRFDEATGQPNCDNDEKIALIKKVAELVGVDMSDVFE